MDIWCCVFCQFCIECTWEYKWMMSCVLAETDFLHPVSLLSFSLAWTFFRPLTRFINPWIKLFAAIFQNFFWQFSGNNEVKGTCFLLVPQLPAGSTSGTCWGFLEVGEGSSVERAQTPAELSHPLSPPHPAPWWVVAGHGSLCSSEDKDWKIVGTFQPSPLPSQTSEI